jgi:peroxiredoxin
MPTQQNPSLTSVNWSSIPAPKDDGATAHLVGMRLPDVALAAADGSSVSLARLAGRSIVFAYPRTGLPGKAGLVDDWDQIPGARGCTPQSCSFRDLNRDLLGAGAVRILGLSTQSSDYQREAVARLHLPFPLLSDEHLELTTAMRLPTMTVAGHVLIKRMSWIVDDGTITAVQYPVFPPDRNAADVLSWLVANPVRR